MNLTLLIHVSALLDQLPILIGMGETMFILLVLLHTVLSEDKLILFFFIMVKSK